MFKLGEVRVAEDRDFDYIRQISESTHDWSLAYEKHSTRVWTKKSDMSAFNMMKVKAEFNDVSATLVYNVLHDSEYRKVWDERMINGHEICTVSPNSDIGYYAVKFPKPFKNRDFVTQRCWIDFGEGKDKIIFNHSVNHVQHLPKKSFVRGISFLTSYLIRPTGQNACTLFYVSQADPGGLPSWICNAISKKLAPKLIKRLNKNCLKYDKWKSKNKPSYMPWINSEQMTAPRFNPKDLLPIDIASLKKENGDESQINEKDVDADDTSEKDD